jgi:hypothetical protein
MSTTIHRKDYKITNGSDFEKEVSVVRFSMPQKYSCKCGYQVTVGSEHVTLTTRQMQDLMVDLETFFYAEGYP